MCFVPINTPMYVYKSWKLDNSDENKWEKFDRISKFFIQTIFTHLTAIFRVIGSCHCYISNSGLASTAPSWPFLPHFGLYGTAIGSSW